MLVKRFNGNLCELHRMKRDAGSQACAGCGVENKKLWHYEMRTDHGNVYPYVGLFCSATCFNDWLTGAGRGWKPLTGGQQHGHVRDQAAGRE